MTRTTRTAWLAALLSLVARADAATLSGHIAGHDGAALGDARVQIVDPATGRERTGGAPDAAGTYDLEYPSAGLVTARFSAPNHAPYQVPILIAGADDRVTLDVRLGAYAYANLAAVDTLYLMGDFNDWSYDFAVPIAKDPDGIYRRTFAVADGELVYQVIGAVPGRSVAGPVADRFVFDGSGDYRSVIETDGALLDLELDPAAFVRGPTEPVVEIDAAHAVSLRLAEPVAEVEARQDRFLFRLHAARQTLDPSAVIAPLREEIALELPDAIARARAATEPEERAARMIGALQAMRLATPESRDPAFVKEAAEALPPDSPFWALAPELIGYVATFEDIAGARALFEAVATRHADAEIRKDALIMGYMRGFRDDDMEMTQAFATRLAREFPDAPENGNARKALATMAADRGIGDEPAAQSP